MSSVKAHAFALSVMSCRWKRKMFPQRNDYCVGLHARLHIPVSGMSIFRTLFFIPARIPPDSLGFLFFPEELFYRNLLLAGLRNPELLRNHRNTPEFLFPPTKTTVI